MLNTDIWGMRYMNGFYPGDNKIAIPNVNETVYY